MFGNSTSVWITPDGLSITLERNVDHEQAVRRDPELYGFTSPQVGGLLHGAIYGLMYRHGYIRMANFISSYYFQCHKGGKMLDRIEAFVRKHQNEIDLDRPMMIEVGVVMSGGQFTPTNYAGGYGGPKLTGRDLLAGKFHELLQESRQWKPQSNSNATSNSFRGILKSKTRQLTYS